MIAQKSLDNLLTKIEMGAIDKMEEIIPVRWSEIDGVWFTHGANGDLIQDPDREKVIALYHLTKDK